MLMSTLTIERRHLIRAPRFSLRRLLCVLTRHLRTAVPFSVETVSGGSLGRMRRCPCGRHWAQKGLTSRLTSGTIFRRAG